MSYFWICVFVFLVFCICAYCVFVWGPIYVRRCLNEMVLAVVITEGKRDTDCNNVLVALIGITRK